MELPAPALRLPARLSGRNVHPYATGPRGTSAEGLVTQRQIIEQEIRERGPIPFSRYMELCLYHPELGYYSRHAEQFGKAGDFYTSSDVHAVFGRLLARQFEEIWRALGSPVRIEILELGPGRGQFAQDVLDWSQKKFPDFFDALPVEVLSSQGALRISAEKGRFIETWAPPSSEELDLLERYGVHPEVAERIEVPLMAQQSMAQIASNVGRGILIAIDYGYTRQEQLAGRHRGTVTAFRQHSISPNPYEAPGEQDITAHANFTALTVAAEQNGMHVHPLITQSQFLMGIGEANQFADAFEECRLPQERAKVALQLKHLVTPAGMGENFHVLLAAKGIDAKNLAGLSGLSFANSRQRGA